jgi:hypothetical protein
MVTTDDVVGVVARSPQNWGRGRHDWLVEEMAKLGATDEELATAAVAGLDSADRNVRVRAVWALSVIADPRATDGILRALRDPARRVREVAMKSTSPHHAGSAEVLAELRRIAEDESETDRLRRYAFWSLSSNTARDALPEMATESMRELMGSEQFRAQILRRLCDARMRSGLDAARREILQEFVRTGTKDEAVMATRALCGQVLVAVNRWLPPDHRQRVREQYDPGPSSDYADSVWMPLDDAIELARSVGLDVR